MPKIKSRQTNNLIRVFPLVALIWMAFAIRLFQLDTQSLWYDEGITWYLSQFSMPELIRWTAADIQPPFYYLIVWLSTHFFGDSEFALRFPSVIFGILAVPLMWRLGRLTMPSSAFLAAWLTVFAPTLIYYSQEARMYTLLVCQSCFASYLVLKIAGANNCPPSPYHFKGMNWSVVAYTIVMASALYTHYFSVFLLIVHAIYLCRRRSGWIILGSIFLCFSPWLPVLFARFGDDPSYWTGSLKLNEIMLDVWISFTVGGKREMIFEADGQWLAAIFGMVFVGCLVRFVQKQNLLYPCKLRVCDSLRVNSNLLFLLAWLIIPIGLILLVAYQAPKFNPRYTMLALPPFILIMAGGLVSFDKLPIKFVILTFITASWLFSLHNWFFVPEFSKDDFKHVAQFIRERSQPNETVLLSSGHFSPVWQYYFGDENWTPLPQMETLDVNQVTNFDIIPEMERALTGKSGAWLVTWQDKVIDPNGVVPFLLDVVGERPNDGGDFWGVGLEHWRFPETMIFPHDYPTDIRTDINFANMVNLRGVKQLKNDVALFWEARQLLEDDYLISLSIVDENNINWTETRQVMRPANYLYPTMRWAVGEVVLGKQSLNWLAGTPPGDYWLEVGWLTSLGQGVDILDEHGSPQRRMALVGPLHVIHPIEGEIVKNSVPIKFDNITLVKSVFEKQTVEAGSKIIWDGVWQIEKEIAFFQKTQFIDLTFTWQDSEGHIFQTDSPHSLYVNYPLGTFFRSRLKSTTPYQAKPGTVTLHANIDTETHAIGHLTLAPTERIFQPPTDFDIALNVNFAHQAMLLGADINPATLELNQTMTITLYWQGIDRFEKDYTVFVHALDDEGYPIINADHAPPRPTSNWLEGEIIADVVYLESPSNLPVGDYPIEVGLYNAADVNFSRLTVVEQNTDYVIVAYVVKLP